MEVLSRLLNFLSFRKSDAHEYPYLVEIRPMLEKYRVKREIRNIVRAARVRKWHKVPHITLVYNFKPKKDVKDWKIAKIIQNVASKYDVVRFYYDGFEIKKGNKGYVFAFKIKPSDELRRLRKEIYDGIKPFIESRPDVMSFNESDENEFWFHATVGYHLSEEKRDMLRDMMQSLKYYFPAFALRITLLKRNKIAYEYDVPTGRLLNRKRALSRKYYVEMAKAHRKLLKVETHRRHSSSRDVWLISDTHFDHANIIKYCARPFSDVNEMNEILVRNWNNTVKKEDIVYFLGDMSFDVRSPRYWIRRLNGNIIYIRGNHEKARIGKDYEILNYRGHRFLLVHNPDSVSSFNGWIIHGHKHNNDLIRYPFINRKRRTINVSVEVINYKPISLNQICQLIDRNMERIDEVIDLDEM